MLQSKLFIDGEWRDGESTIVFRDKFDDATLAEVHHAGPELVQEALKALDHAHGQRAFGNYDRYRTLSRAACLIEERSAPLIDTIVNDTGFTVRDAEREVSRAIQTMTLSAEEAKRIHGEVVPLHGAPGISGRFAFTIRSPLGVVSAITPFNSPLNTVVHKVAPALAAGNAVVLKPAAQTPLTAALLVEILLDSDVPPDLIALLHGDGATVGEALLHSPIPAFYAFTGSTAVGEHISRTVGLRKTQLELGSISSTLVCNDAALDRAVSACVGAAFRKAGQVCTSVQRLYVQRGVYADCARALSRETAMQAYGDPRRSETVTGPLISRSDAERVERWITTAADAGADVLTGGHRDGNVVAPTVLAHVGAQMDVMCKEVFGPVVSLVQFDDLDDAIDQVNNTPYGLAAGIFTSNIATAMTAAERLRMGSVHINETSSSRVDLMPYGGVKASGLGHEGPRYAIEEMTELRLISVGRP